MVHFPYLFCQTILFQFDSVCRKSGGINDIASGFYKLSLQANQHIFMLQNPFFRADAGRHSSFQKVGTCRAIQKNRRFFYQIHKSLFCHCFLNSFMFIPAGLLPYCFPNQRLRRFLSRLRLLHPSYSDNRRRKYCLLPYR